MRWACCGLLFLALGAACSTSEDAAGDAAVGGPDGAAPACPGAADCSGLTCGVDPVCGEPCGVCGEGFECTEGACACVPDCVMRICGPDGCGGTCGDCDAGEFCTQGRCRVAPAGCPDDAMCDGLACGPDPVCGLSCGECPAGDCLDGRCVCLPECAGRECGDDGCGGVCGTCRADELCREGDCAPLPDGCPGVADCSAVECGPDPVCGTPCGACELGECDHGQCVCEPTCRGAVCGDDGCGGVCGECGENEVCSEGACACPRQRCEGACCGEGEICVGGECCAPLWDRRVPDTELQAGAFVGERLLVAGWQDGQPTLLEVDRCGAVGVTLRGAPLAPTGRALAVLGTPQGPVVGGQLAEGDAAGAGWLNGLNPALAPRFAEIVAGPGQVWVTGLAAAGEGFWRSSVVGLPDDARWSMGFHQADGSSDCEVPVSEGESFGGRMAISPLGIALSAGFADNTMALHGVPVDCGGGCICGAVIDARVEIPDAAGSSGLDVDVLGSAAFVVGNRVLADGDSAGLIARVSLISGQVGDTALWDSGPGQDSFLAVLRSGPTLFAGGVANFSLANLPASRAVVVEFSEELEELRMFDFGQGVVRDLVASPSGGIYVIIQTLEGGRVLYCSAQMECVE